MHDFRQHRFRTSDQILLGQFNLGVNDYAQNDGVHIGIFVRIIHDKAEVLDGLEFVCQDDLLHKNGSWDDGNTTHLRLAVDNNLRSPNLLPLLRLRFQVHHDERVAFAQVIHLRQAHALEGQLR